MARELLALRSEVALLTALADPLIAAYIRLGRAELVLQSAAFAYALAYANANEGERWHAAALDEANEEKFAALAAVRATNGGNDG